MKNLKNKASELSFTLVPVEPRMTAGQTANLRDRESYSEDSLRFHPVPTVVGLTTFPQEWLQKIRLTVWGGRNFRQPMCPLRMLFQNRNPLIVLTRMTC